jgi:hypothetical protein
VLFRSRAGSHELTIDSIEEFGGEFPGERLNQPTTFRISVSVTGKASLAVQAMTSDDTVMAALRLTDSHITGLVQAGRVTSLYAQLARDEEWEGACVSPDIEVLQGEAVHHPPAPISQEFCTECAGMVAVPLSFRPLTCPICATPASPCARCCTRNDPALCRDCPPLSLTAIGWKYPDSSAWTDEQSSRAAVAGT